MKTCICLDQLSFDLSRTISLVDLIALHIPEGDSKDTLENVITLISDKLREIHNGLEERILFENQTQGNQIYD